MAGAGLGLQWRAWGEGYESRTVSCSTTRRGPASRDPARHPRDGLYLRAQRYFFQTEIWPGLSSAGGGYRVLHALDMREFSVPSRSDTRTTLGVRQSARPSS